MQKTEVRSQKSESTRQDASIFCLLSSVSCLLFCSISIAAEEPLPPALDWAVSRGLGYLARQQQPDGSFSGFDDSGPRAEPAAEALLAFFAAGQTASAGRDALVVRGTIDFLVRQLPDDGEFGRADGSGARGQALITLALAQAYGMEDAMGGGANGAAAEQRRKAVREALDKSLRAILAMQDAAPAPGGGWKAEGHNQPDLMTTLWMALALHSLADAGWEVPRDATGRAAAFVRSCAKPRPSRASEGYAGPGAAGPTAASTAAALATLLLLDEANPQELKDAHKVLADKRVDADASSPAAEEYYRSLYAVSLAIWLARGDLAAPGAASPAAAWKATREALVSKQAEDGSWFPLRPPPVGLGTVPATADAVLSLTVGYRLLPAYAR
jgi:hypothetical protein